ncbi:MAG: hypothetical protein PVSMB3_13390 [Candidatus Dormibacteraceae bacterium]
MTDHGHVLLVVDQRAKAIGDHLMVFDDKDASRIVGHSDSLTFQKFDFTTTDLSTIRGEEAGTGSVRGVELAGAPIGCYIGAPNSIGHETAISGANTQPGKGVVLVRWFHRAHYPGPAGE